ncbi:MAG: hypothetical protein CME21_21630 [Gemmatimonadetes bacterium]|nr:hypothetical protein [Gemmatimonadota bacterium]
MANITSIRSFLKDTQAGLDLLLSLTDEQLESREKFGDMKNMLLTEREAADRLVTEIREWHLDHVTGFGFKAKKRHLEEALENFEMERSSDLFAKPTSTYTPAGEGETYTPLVAAIRAAEAEEGKIRIEGKTYTPLLSRTPLMDAMRAAAESEADGNVDAAPLDEPEERVPTLAEVIAAPIDDREEEEVQPPLLVDLFAENVEPCDDEEPDPAARATSLYDSIRRLDLRKTATAALEDADIRNLGQLISQTPDYLLSLPQFGTASLDDVVEGLKALGLDWPNGERAKEATSDAQEILRRNSAYARAYYRKHRKKILKQQSDYRRDVRNKLQKLEDISNEGGDQ